MHALLLLLLLHQPQSLLMLHSVQDSKEEHRLDGGGEGGAVAGAAVVGAAVVGAAVVGAAAEEKGAAEVDGRMAGQMF